MKELTVKADVKNLPAVTQFVDEILEANECPMKAQMQIDIAIDELFSNIAYYAYESGDGEAIIGVDVQEGPKRVVVTFMDSGKQYNPLDKEDPDVTLSAEERQIGGLGIFMVKKSMDDVIYQYQDKKNILTIVKNI